MTTTNRSRVCNEIALQRMIIFVLVIVDILVASVAMNQFFRGRPREHAPHVGSDKHPIVANKLCSADKDCAAMEYMSCYGYFCERGVCKEKTRDDIRPDDIPVKFLMPSAGELSVNSAAIFDSHDPMPYPEREEIEKDLKGRTKFGVDSLAEIFRNFSVLNLQELKGLLRI